MLNTSGRGLGVALFGPVARLFVRWGISPNAVTVVSALLVVGAALFFLPRGQFVAGPLVLGALVACDNIDGQMARLRGGGSRWGGFLDSTFDRLSDAALVGGLLLWGVADDDRPVIYAALAALVFGALVPYARAKAESLGLEASGGIAERADRVVVLLVGVLAVGLGAPQVVLTVVLGVLAAASLITVGQRFAAVRRQLQAEAAGAQGRPIVGAGDGSEPPGSEPSGPEASGPEASGPEPSGAL